MVAACIVREGRLLATRRGHGAHVGRWEFPGGKVEPGEDPSAALAREIREELDADIAVGPLLGVVTYDYGDFQIELRAYRCELASSFVLLEHAEARWLTEEEWDSVDWLEPDRALLESLR
ncbi:MAG: (deoxy)nucleoside triphosphate pyrophosphohydrolase [Propionibacteriaceae bacterium]|nr:(deoxy)nucleoside triphosphate pyrophosphohydrolase [Propionibacteriaceae bacterium]